MQLITLITANTTGFGALMLVMFGFEKGLGSGLILGSFLTHNIQEWVQSTSTTHGVVLEFEFVRHECLFFALT